MFPKHAHFAGSVLLTFLFFICLPAAKARVILPPCFTDNMVLQQNTKVTLWGKAAPGKTVTITPSWDNKRYYIKADADSSWKIKVTTPKYGGPYTLTFNDGEATTLNNILIGEVWVCSGQSNMEMIPSGFYGNILNFEEEKGAANYPEIRTLKIENTYSMQPQTQLKTKGDWRVCSPETFNEFSAVSYFFARDFYNKYHIPVGLINTTWGGTVAEAWTSREALKQMPAFAPAVTAMENGLTQEQLNKQYENDLREWVEKISKKDPLYSNGKLPWIEKGFDDSRWKEIKEPDYWEKTNPELAKFDGVLALRKTVTIPAGWAGKDHVLNLGALDDMDVAWFNGTEIGHTELFLYNRSYKIPGSLVKAGKNTIAIRIIDNGGLGGFNDKANPHLAPAGEAETKIDLSGMWKYNIVNNLTDLPAAPYKPDGPNRPTLLYNTMINPLIDYTIKGVIWYQGESNADRAYQYRTLFPLMIKDWRNKWGQGNFPFYFVQLANYMPREPQPTESAWAELREAQLKTLALPNTGMAVIIDIGDANNIHPANKQEVGRRLSLIARAKTYGESIAYSGPVYKSHTIKANKAILTFDFADGLQAKNGKLTGFSIAGADKKFYWADAEIKDNKVIVWSDKVPKPVAVRYAWANNPDCNLYNSAALPASPFRTDDWQGITYGK